MRKIVSLILLAIISLAVTGCQQTAKKPQASSKLTDNMLVNIYYLAGKLGMNVTTMTEDKITFIDSLNTVIIHPVQNQVFVNENYIGSLGKTQKADGMLMVRLSLAGEIKRKLNQPQPKIVVPPASDPVVPPKPANLPEQKKNWASKGKKIVVDAGHGGKDPGAISYHGFYEKTINLDVATQIAQMLRDNGYKVIMTRDNDEFVELDDRARIANQSKADSFVSIHSDASAKSSTNGFSIYTAHAASDDAEELAYAIDDRLTRTSINSNGVKQADFRVLVRTQCPAVLVELGYLSNYWEAKQLKNVAMQKKLAQAIVEGIENYFKNK